jgi:hypothetical protein
VFPVSAVFVDVRESMLMFASIGTGMVLVSEACGVGVECDEACGVLGRRPS